MSASAIRKSVIALSQYLRTGVDYFFSLPIDELNDLAEEVIAHAKRQAVRTRN